jgi:hypothetical protein
MREQQMKKLLLTGAALAALLCGVAPAADAATDTARVQDITRECATWARHVDPLFDAYYDPGGERWHMFGTKQSVFYFDKCLVQHGLSMGPLE